MPAGFERGTNPWRHGEKTPGCLRFAVSNQKTSMATVDPSYRFPLQFPRKLIIYGVEGQDFQTGTNLSPAMELAIKNVVSDVLREAHRYDPSRGVKRLQEKAVIR
jgi:hypothetical protein